jgi:hypothetical protein
MTIRFACGHPAIQVERTVETSPKCPVCGERVVSLVLNATPVFKGACQGPLVQK